MLNHNRGKSGIGNPYNTANITVIRFEILPISVQFLNKFGLRRLYYKICENYITVKNQSL